MEGKVFLGQINSEGLGCLLDVASGLNAKIYLEESYDVGGSIQAIDVYVESEECRKILTDMYFNINEMTRREAA
ncbi:MAG: hypothetical protein G8237_02875 [Magnetococcales bacterium]|nr:hypothetical protein [Magnetococcales bacterium]